jgi:hypothetical protein
MVHQQRRPEMEIHLSQQQQQLIQQLIPNVVHLYIIQIRIVVQQQQEEHQIPEL